MSWQVSVYKLFEIVTRLRTVRSGAHPDLYSMGTGTLFPGIKWQGMKLNVDLKILGARMVTWSMFRI